MGTRTDIVVAIMAGTAIAACTAAGTSGAIADGRTRGTDVTGDILNRRPVERLTERLHIHRTACYVAYKSRRRFVPTAALDF
ncbi:MAG: hypothetical protein WBH00_20415 [Xanthobacteraceae bacterium]